jgi:hypothetical protein
MNPATHSSIRMFGVWCGPLYVLGLLLGWWIIAGFLPAPPPTTGVEQIAATFQEDATRIRIGMVVLMYCAMIFMPFAAAITHFMGRIEGSPGVLSYTALLGGAGNMVLTFYPAIWWLVAAYRPERAAELIYLFNDLAWLQFIGGVSMFDALPLAIAVAAFCDKSANPVFPRWAGYFNVMVVLLILPDQLVFFFHSGSFAWNGLFGLWIPLVLFGLWFLVTFWLMRQAVLRERLQGVSVAAAYPQVSPHG